MIPRMAKARKAPKTTAAGAVLPQQPSQTTQTAADSDAAPPSEPPHENAATATQQATDAASQPDSHGSPTQEQQQPVGDALEQPDQASSQPDNADAGNAVSNAHPISGKASSSGQPAQPAATKDSSQDAGNVPEATTSAATADDAIRARTRVVNRLCAEKIWNRDLSELRDRMVIEAKASGMTKEQAQVWTYDELDRLYPPKAQPIALLNTAPKESPDNELSAADKAPIPRNSGVQGLGDIPPGWPTLPANAALSAEVAWVQANRLYVVEELSSGGTRVHLDRAHEPAPSRSAIGWLETSIRSYAKFVEVAAKVSGPGDDEGEQVKRERMAIDEIRGLLVEMAGNPPGPGR